MVVDSFERYPGNSGYSKESTHEHENDGDTNNPGWMLYSVYTVLGVN